MEIKFKDNLTLYCDTCVISTYRDYLTLANYQTLTDMNILSEMFAFEQIIKLIDSGIKIKLIVSDDNHHEIQKMRTPNNRAKNMKQEILTIFSVLEKEPYMKLGHSACWDSGYRWDRGAVWAGENTDNNRESIENDLMRWSGSKKPGKFREDAQHLSNMLVKENRIDIFLTRDEKSLLKYREKIFNSYKIKLAKPSEILKTLISQPKIYVKFLEINGRT